MKNVNDILNALQNEIAISEIMKNEKLNCNELDKLIIIKNKLQNLINAMMQE